MILADGFSEKAQEQLAEAVQAAANREPLAYLVLAFSVAMFIIMLRFVAGRDSREEDRNRRHEECENQRMVTMREMAQSCHIQAANNIQIVSSITAECRAVIDRNNDILEDLLKKQ